MQYFLQWRNCTLPLYVKAQITRVHEKINQTYYQQCTFRPFCFVSCADAFLSITSTRNYPPKIVKRQMWDALQRWSKEELMKVHKATFLWPDKSKNCIFRVKRKWISATDWEEPSAGRTGKVWSVCVRVQWFKKQFPNTSWGHNIFVNAFVLQLDVDYSDSCE